MSGIVSDNKGRSSGLIKSGVTDYDDNKLQSNIALLGFKTAVNGSLAKYNLQDQIIDEYEDASGIDAGNSTNERLTAGVYDGTTSSASTPTRTVPNAETPIVDGDYTVYKWHSTGSYSADANETAEWLVVAGGGGGGDSGNTGGGGGAGGLRTSYGSASGGGASVQADLSLVSGTTYTITVGAGGAGGSGDGTGSVGGASSITGSDITNITTVGGGGGGGYNSGTVNGGSGGGAGDPDGSATTAGTATSGEGFAGGAHGGATGNDTTQASGGGGGAAAVGADGVHATSGGTGGAGLGISITGASVGYAGGGGGGTDSATPGGASHGGGASGTNSAGTAGTANTGGGGGGGAGGGVAGGAGGSGIVILRVSTQATTITSGGDLTLQSTDTTAMAEPDYADMVILMENAEGTATINTDIKGWISKDSGSTFTQGTLVDEGTWGTDKKIYAFHDLDISAQSGTSMCYKITTHNQSEGSKETKIHATSIGWR